MGLTFIDFFAGIGGFRRGMERAGHKCVGFCEFDKFAVASYVSMHCITNEQREYLQNIPLTKSQKKHLESLKDDIQKQEYIYNCQLKNRQKEILKEKYRNGEWFANDVRSVDARSIPRADVWCFGFPCQDISVAGKQLGFNGHRSSLFFAVMRIIQQLKEEDRPKYLFIENVKNLLSVNGGFDFAKLLIELDEGGYDAEWQVINSADYVPQNRERVFIIGHLRGAGTSKVFPIERANRENRVCQIGKFDYEGNKVDNPSSYRVYDCDSVSPTLRAATGGMVIPLVGIKEMNEE